MIHTPAVLSELEKLVSVQGLSERNGESFKDRLWEWLLSTEEGKEANQRRLTAARILARVYITDRLEESPPEPFQIEGIDEDAIQVLTGIGPEQR